MANQDYSTNDVDSKEEEVSLDDDMILEDEDLVLGAKGGSVAKGDGDVDELDPTLSPEDQDMTYTESEDESISSDEEY